MPITQDEAQAVTLAFTRDYPGALDLAYYFRDNTKILYGSRATEISEDIKGGYLSKELIHNGRSYRGRVDVPLENVDDAEDLLETLRHEVLGHYGSNTFTPTEKRALLDGLIAAREEPGLKDRWHDINQRYTGSSIYVQAEEIWAQHCETITSDLHIGQPHVKQRGTQSFVETCIDRVRPMQVSDLHNIACMVADGIHDRSRIQQNFPSIGEVLRKDDAMKNGDSIRETHDLNTVEPNIEKKQQRLAQEQDTQGADWLKKPDVNAPKSHSKKTQRGNRVESDEIFTATQTDIKLAVPPDVEKRYIHVGNKFYHAKNTDLVAFEDKGNKLETRSNSETIAESMVRIAEARGWDELKVSGSEAFRREVWLAAAARGMQVKGYTPTDMDKAALAKLMRHMQANKVEINEKNHDNANLPPEKRGLFSPKTGRAEAFRDSPVDAVKKHPELAGAAAAIAAIEKKVQADGLSAEQRSVVMGRVRENFVNNIERGQIPEIKVKENMEVKHETREEKELSR